MFRVVGNIQKEWVVAKLAYAFVIMVLSVAGYYAWRKHQQRLFQEQHVNIRPEWR